MNNKAISGIMLTLLLASMSLLAFSIQLVESDPIKMNLVDPMINPKSGQYANYIVECYQEEGTILWSGWWNFSYLDYVVADLINATHAIKTAPNTGTYWLVINVTDRWIPFGNHWWVESWYVPWVETNVTVGCVLKMWKTNGTVFGSRISTIRLNGQETSIDCWIIQFSEPGNPSVSHTFLFDKQSGIGIEGISSYVPYTKLTLVSTNIPIGALLSATIDIKPHTLNLRSKCKWITAYIELPKSYDVNDINVTTVMLNDTIPAELHPTEVGDYDGDGIPDLMVKFDRFEVIFYILANVNMTELFEERFVTITLTITGKLNDGPPFQGSDTIKIIYMIPRGLGRRGIFPI